ncbi:MAG: hypothetical protein CMJ88_03255 [Planctomycetes bacterium]|nr:hypothetical protein [Planctomycetota bacterium]
MLAKRTILLVFALFAVACGGRELAPSIWPPEDFSLVVEETREDGDRMHVIRRLQVDASGLVIYGTSSQPLVDAKTGASLPVLDRLAVYGLEPTSLRFLARKLDRLGIATMSPPTTAVSSGLGVAVTWEAFAQRRVLTSTGRPRGALGEVLALLAAHLPPGESFDTKMTRPVVPVLQGVPSPVTDAGGALAALGERLGERPEDAGLLLSSFALACRVGDRSEADRLLDRWQAVASAAAGSAGFAADTDKAVAARAEVFRRLLPR